MPESYDQKYARITNEKYLVMTGMVRPEFQLIMTKLNQAAGELQKEYDSLDLVKDQYKAIYIQAYRKIVLYDLRNILEEIMNVDSEVGEPEWSFFGWLRSIQECINGIINDGWLKRIRKIFKL